MVPQADLIEDDLGKPSRRHPLDIEEDVEALRLQELKHQARRARSVLSAVADEYTTPQRRSFGLVHNGFVRHLQMPLLDALFTEDIR